MFTGLWRPSGLLAILGGAYSPDAYTALSMHNPFHARRSDFGNAEIRRRQKSMSEAFNGLSQGAYA